MNHVSYSLTNKVFSFQFFSLEETGIFFIKTNTFLELLYKLNQISLDTFFAHLMYCWLLQFQITTSISNTKSLENVRFHIKKPSNFTLVFEFSCEGLLYTFGTKQTSQFLIIIPYTSWIKIGRQTWTIYNQQHKWPSALVINI